MDKVLKLIEKAP